MWSPGLRKIALAEEAQDRITTPTEAELASHTGSCLSSHDESKLAESFLQSDGALGMRMTQLWEPLSENLLRTRALCAEEAADVNDEIDWTTSRWKVV
jgi:hypothetical protein